jgi:cation diffusion facilitator family transporter
MSGRRAGGSKLIVYAALAGNLAIAATKFVAAAITGSSAILSEGVHSVVDTSNEAFLLYGMRRAREPADALHPFGHGKEIYFWSFVVALLLFAAGAGVAIIVGMWRLLHPMPLEHPLANYIVLAVSALFEGSSWFVAFRHFRDRIGRHGLLRAIRRAKDPVDFAVLLEDSAALTGIAVAVVGIGLEQWTGDSAYDAGASIVIGAILGTTALWLARETKGLLIGEAANQEVLSALRRLAAARPEIERVHEVLTMHVGPDYIFASLSLTFIRALPVDEPAVLEEITDDIRRAEPRVRRVFYEVRRRDTHVPTADA